MDLYFSAQVMGLADVDMITAEVLKAAHLENAEYAAH